MKKILAMMLTAAMMLSMSAAVMAEQYGNDENVDNVATQPNGTTYIDIESVDLDKTYTLINSGMTSPAEDFSFTITKEAVSDSAITEVANIPAAEFANVVYVEDEDGDYVLDENNQYVEAGENVAEGTTLYKKDLSKVGTTTTIHFNEGEATTGGDTNSTYILLPEYETVGIYTYKIVENAGKTAGVDYDETALYLKVTVIEQNGLIRVASIRYSNATTGEKWEALKNTYTAGSLAVKKTVDGNMGDQTKDFEVTVTFTKDANVEVNAPIYWTSDAGENDDDYDKSIEWATTTTEGVTTQNDSTTVTINLKHNETVTFTNIPDGVSYTVVENDYVTTVDNYDSTSYTGTDVTGTVTWTGAEGTTNTGVTGVMSDASEKVEIVNTKGTTVDTGISVDSIPYIAMLGVVAVGGAGVVVSKKRRSED